MTSQGYPEKSTSSNGNVEVFSGVHSIGYVNNTYPDQDFAMHLVHLLDEGMPAGWEELPDEDIHEVEYAGNIGQDISVPSVLIGQFEGKSVIAKPKIYYGGNGLKFLRARIGAGVLPASDAVHVSDASVRYEISLAPKIKKVIEDQTLQDQIKQFSKPEMPEITGIKFVEPIMGIEYKKPPRAYTVFEFIEGAGALDSDQVLSKFGINLDIIDIHDLLEGHFQSNGIEPVDLSPRHLLIDGQGMIHLIDTESYRIIDSDSVPHQEVA